MEARTQLKAARDEALKRLGREKRNKRVQPSILRMERDVAVLWGLYHGWCDERIG